MKKPYCILVILISIRCLLIAQQHLDIQGSLRLTTLDTVTSAERVLALDGDGEVVSYALDSLTDQVSMPIPYQSGWQNLGVLWSYGRITKRDDRVYVEGVIRKTSGNVAINDHIFTLPEGYRPSHRTILWANQNANTIRLNADPDGRVWVVSGTSSYNWLSLGGTSFYRRESLHPSQIEIGDTYAGGYVFFKADPPVDLDSDGLLDHGLVAAPFDQSNGTSWGCTGDSIVGPFSKLIGSGYQNTNNIISQCTESNSAARVCADLSLNGYDDWVLPTWDEVQMMYHNIGPGGGNIGGFESDRYWTSQQHSPESARSVDMTANINWISDKSFEFRVRAIRAYSLFSHESLGDQLTLDIHHDLQVQEIDSASHVDHILGSSAEGRIAAVPVAHAKTQVPYPTAVSYQPNYQDNADGYLPLGYYKYEDRVYLDGTALRSTGTPAVGDTVFYLPPSHRPHYRIVLQSKHQSGSIRLNVDPTGAVWIVEGSTPNRWLSFDGCNFWRKENSPPE